MCGQNGHGHLVKIDSASLKINTIRIYIYIYYYSEQNPESEIHFDHFDLDHFDRLIKQAVA